MNKVFFTEGNLPSSHPIMCGMNRVLLMLRKVGPVTLVGFVKLESTFLSPLGPLQEARRGKSPEVIHKVVVE